MPTYVKRPDTFEARQFDGSADWDLIRWCSGSIRALDSGAFAVALGDVHRAYVGDWIVQDTQDGTYRVLSPQQFRYTYEARPDLDPAPPLPMPEVREDEASASAVDLIHDVLESVDVRLLGPSTAWEARRDAVSVVGDALGLPDVEMGLVDMAGHVFVRAGAGTGVELTVTHTSRKTAATAAAAALAAVLAYDLKTANDLEGPR